MCVCVCVCVCLSILRILLDCLFPPLPYFSRHKSDRDFQKYLQLNTRSLLPHTSFEFMDQSTKELVRLEEMDDIALRMTDMEMENCVGQLESIYTNNLKMREIFPGKEFCMTKSVSSVCCCCWRWECPLIRCTSHTHTHDNNNVYILSLFPCYCSSGCTYSETLEGA